MFVQYSFLFLVGNPVMFVWLLNTHNFNKKVIKYNKVIRINAMN